MLSMDDIAPHFLRMMGATPAIYLLVAVGLWEVSRFLWQQCNAFQRRASLPFRLRDTTAAIALGIAVSGLILVQGVLTYRAYFQTWAAAPEVYDANETEWTELARTLNALPSATQTVYLLPYTISEHFSFQYLYQGAAPADVIPAGMPYLTQEIESSLAAVEKLATVRFIDWNNDFVSGDALAEEHAVVLLGKYGRYLGSDEFNSFRIHTFTDINLERPWTFYEHLEPLTVQYEGGIDLQGLALGQGQKQLSTQQPPSLGKERTLWSALQWRTAPGLEVGLFHFPAPARCRRPMGLPERCCPPGPEPSAYKRLGGGGTGGRALLP